MLNIKLFTGFPKCTILGKVGYTLNKGNRVCCCHDGKTFWPNCGNNKKEELQNPLDSAILLFNWCG